MINALSHHKIVFRGGEKIHITDDGHTVDLFLLFYAAKCNRHAEYFDLVLTSQVRQTDSCSPARSLTFFHSQLVCLIHNKMVK